MKLTTNTGLKIDPGNMKPEDFNIYDIAAGLSAMPRFAGQTNKVYTVASHSIILSKIVPPEFAKCALLHDLSEAYVMDLPSPVKRLLPDYIKLESNIMDVGLQAFNIPKEHMQYIKSYDKNIAETERKVLFNLHGYTQEELKLVKLVEYELSLTRRAIMLNFIDTYTKLC